MNKDPFQEYIRESEPTKREKGYAWHTAIGLQAVDGLKISDYLMHTAIRNIEGEIIHHLAVFISRLWQIHVFGEGNTRTTAVFFIKYLRTLGFDVTNDIFAENAWYFRNSLVRANYNDLKNGIYETTEFLEAFLRNLLLNENHPLHNRTLHISGFFKETTNTRIDSTNASSDSKKANSDTEKMNLDMEEANIVTRKVNIDTEKVNLLDALTAKTSAYVQMLRENLGSQAAFGRSDVQKVLGLKPTRSSALLQEMLKYGIIEPVIGHGKGKYCFLPQFIKR